MTVTTDLQTNIGIIRTLFIKIDGIEPIYWQKADKAAPSWDRTIYECMNCNYEDSIELNPTKPIADSPAVTFELFDFNENDGTSYFAKLFAPRRWEAAAHCYLAQDVTVDSILPSNSTIIPCDDTSALDADGYVYLGQECIKYTSKTNTSLTGCTRGLYPAIYGQSNIHSHIRPYQADIDYIMPISAVPFNMIGRMVTLYAITYDLSTNSWQNEENAYLIWVGRISDKIIYDKKIWKLSCEGLVKDLEKSFCTNLSSTKLASLLNITGTADERTLYVSILIDEQEASEIPITYRFYQSIEITEGLYSLDGETSYPSLINTINDLLESGTWYDNSGDEVSRDLEFNIIWQDDKIGINIQSGISKWIDAAETGNMKQIIWIRSGDKGISFSPILAILGFPQKTVIQMGKGDYDSNRISTSLDWFNHTHVADKEPKIAYHPLNRQNGGKLYVIDHSALISDQGDWAHGALAAVEIEADLEERGAKDCNILLRYYGKGKITEDNVTSQYLDLVAGQAPIYETYDYIAWKSDEDAPDVIQIYNPARESQYVNEFSSIEYSSNSVFKVLLRLLLSSGTKFVNSSTYDILHRRIAGLTFPESIIDVTSFEIADEEISSESLADRDIWRIKKEDKSYDTIINELILFGYALVFSNQKFTIIRISPLDVNTYQYEITDHSAKSFELGTDTVLNSYECSISLDPITLKKDKNKIIITDADSVEGLNQKRIIKINHSGLISTGSLIKESLEKFLRYRFLRYPGMKVKITLNTEYLTKISEGDIIILNNSYIYDPVTGVLGGSWYCWVTKIAKYYSKGWSIIASLLIIKSVGEGRGNPWGGSVLVDYDASNGGWNASSYILSLKPLEFGSINDYDDGKVFNSTDKIVIVQRNATDPSSPLIWGPFTLNEDYEGSVANALKLPDGTELTDWDANQEYVVISADYTETPTTQLDEGSWMCDEDTARFSDGSIGYRW